MPRSSSRPLTRRSTSRPERWSPPNKTEAFRLRGGHAALIRTIESLAKLLDRLKKPPAESLHTQPNVSFVPAPALKLAPKDQPANGAQARRQCLGSGADDGGIG